MAYLKKEVQYKVVQELENLRHVANLKVRRNKFDIKKLVAEQAVLKRSAKQYSELIWSMKNK